VCLGRQVLLDSILIVFDVAVGLFLVASFVVVVSVSVSVAALWSSLDRLYSGVY